MRELFDKEIAFMADALSISPFLCRMWSGHDRLEEHINEITCRDEITSFVVHGQLVPVLGRALKDDRDHLYELVFGARRLFVARHLNVPLKVDVRPMSDREAIVALDIENRQRRDVSPYERGRSYASWLRAGLFASQDELSRVLNVSASQVSRLLRLAQLPTVLVSAFASPTEICESWARDLMEAWEDPETRPRLTAGARYLANQSDRRSAAGVFQQLMSSANGKRKKTKQNTPTQSHDEVVQDDHGKPLFRMRVHRKDVALLLPTTGLSDELLVEIKAQIAQILQRARSQPIGWKQKTRGAPSLQKVTGVSIGDRAIS
jgi:ParB family transcriptional regulator, chromosome partitioning protein